MSLEETRHRVLDLQRILEERDEELGAAREAHRRLMAEINRARSPRVRTVSPAD